MTFSIDLTRSFLKIEESNLLSLHRSILPIVPSADYCQGHLYDAFICVVHEYSLHRVYLALHNQLIKSNLIFISDPIRPDNKKLEALMVEAQAFLENIGFEMKQVDLNFSSATREVIIKSTRVMREPSLALQFDAAKMAIEGLIAEKKEILLKASREQLELKTELEDIRRRLVAATAVQLANSEKQAATALQVGPDPLQKDSGILCDEWEELRLVSAEKELQEAREELNSIKTTLKSTMETLKNVKDEARQARKEQKFYKRESDLLKEQLKSGQMEIDKARNEIEVVHREFHEARKAYEFASNERVAHNDEVEAAHQAETADLKAEISRLTTELAGNGLTYSGEVEVLKAAFTEAKLSLSVEKAKNESALQEMDALERNASVELKLLKKKVDTLTAEKQQLEKLAAEIKIKAHGEIEQQQQINQSQRKAAIKKLNVLKEEIRQLAEARAVIASPTGMPVVQSGINVPSPAAEDRKEICFTSDPFGSHEAFETDEYINFLPNKLLKGIPYLFPTDVVKIYRSYNTINAAPNGKQAQRCDGFVCLVTEGDQYQVYVAWLMNSSGEALICLPDVVADGDESCLRILNEGIGYFERIGFFIDKLHLEQDPDKRQIQLDGLAVFCRTVTDCAA